MRTGITFRLPLPITLIVLVLFSLSANSQSYNKDYIDGKIYLKFKDHVQVNIPVNDDRSVDPDNARFLDEVRQQFDITALARPFDLNNDTKLLKTFEISFSGFDRIEELKEELAKNPDVEYVENVPLCRIDYTPNDSLYNRDYGSSNWNWHLDVINAEMAWDFNQGSSDIKVAIVDGAVWVDHPDLDDKIVISEDVTQPGVQNSNPPSNGDPAEWSHGTHCAGLAAAESDNLIGVASIGFNVSLIGVKASNIPGFVTAGYSGIQWAANNGADVISLSWGGPSFSQTEQNIVNAAYNLGCVLVGAAGNDNVSTIKYPAGYAHVIAVASTNEDDVKTDFSNYGTYIDVSAPGGYGNNGPNGLLSTTWDNTSYGYYDVYAGTSMATPLTAGLCGLILSVNPELTPDEVETILKASSENIYSVPGNETYAGKLGAGRIDAYAAVTSTPFQPAADFSTPIPYVKPGANLQFTDLTVGVPNSWSWEFTGGQPFLSSQQNPTITYLTEGVFTVKLEVTNSIGEDTEIKTGYITVTNTPVPWIVYSASETYACNHDTIVFSDESLYEPTAWNWEFTPSSVTFVDGTTMNSKDPHVRFESPGYYSVTLTASNANGSNSLATENMIFIEGIQLNYSEDFESGTSNDFVLSHNARAKVYVDVRAAAPGSTNGLHFQGSPQTGAWSGGPVNTTPEQAWNVNVFFHGFAENCNIDATGIAGIGLTLDLRQTFSIGNKYSWFRVLVNGEPVSDIYGNENFNPSTNTDPFDTKIFDLSEYGNNMFSLALQSSCYLSDKFYAEGDNVFVDNIMLSNTTTVREGSGQAGVLTYPNPVTGVLNYSARGTGDEVTVKILNMQGQTLMQESIDGYVEGEIRHVNTNSLSNGLYILQISGNKGNTTKKFVVD